MNHRYLFTLEVVPLEVGKVYDTLPSHLTLMSRFLTKLSSDELADMVHPLFTRTIPIDLAFAGTTELGPKQVTVHIVAASDSIKRLHGSLFELLDSAHVSFEYPQYIGDNHKPHVTKRQGVWFKEDDTLQTAAAYLIEIVDKKRLVRCRFELGGRAGE